MAFDFNALLLDDAKTVFAGGEFSETVTYTPRVGAARQIGAIVFRDPLQTVEEAQLGKAPLLEIHVANDASSGILASAFDGGDTITVAPIVGGRSYDFELSREDLQVHDAGLIVFRLYVSK